MSKGPRWITEAEVEGQVIPEGGTTNQVLAKESDADFDLKWATGGGGGGSPGGSNTDIQFNDSDAFGGEAGLRFNKTADNVSIGDNYSALPSNTPGLQIGSNVGGFGALLALGSDDANTGAPQLNIYSSNGTTAAPEISADGNALGQINFKGYNGASFPSVAAIEGQVSGTVVSLGAVPGKMLFRVVNDADGVMTDYLVLDGKTGTITLSKPSKVVFPDADPHIAGAGYWVAGVLTKSAG